MRDVPPELNELSRAVVDAAYEIHQTLGPGLLERVYRACLAHELRLRGHVVQEEVSMPMSFKGMEVERAYRMDLLVDGAVVVEVKAVEGFHPLHGAQLLTYLKLSGLRLGLLINFNSVLLKSGLHRVVHTF